MHPKYHQVIATKSFEAKQGDEKIEREKKTCKKEKEKVPQQKRGKENLGHDKISFISGLCKEKE